MSKPFKPKAHPYDKAREDLKEAGGGLFNKPTLKILHSGRLFEGSWRGPVITNWMVQLQGFHPNRVYCAKFELTQFMVYIPYNGPDDIEAVNGIADAFMDLINARRAGD